jgi:hypothetical protein
MPGLNLIVDIEDAVMRRPVASVEHAVTRTDTAWLVDAKVKFWRDTLGAGFRIATYFLANVDAANYSTLGLDLRMGEVQNFIAQGDSLSTWITDVPNLDSTRNVTSNGEVYVHPFVLVDNFWPLSFLGRELGSFTPFGFQFNENDIIGTRSTPIRSYFLYPEEMEDPDEMAYAFEPAFLTVIWFQNPATGNVSYINSFLSTSRWGESESATKKPNPERIGLFCLREIYRLLFPGEEGSGGHLLRYRFAYHGQLNVIVFG